MDYSCQPKICPHHELLNWTQTTSTQYDYDFDPVCMSTELSITYLNNNYCQPTSTWFNPTCDPIKFVNLLQPSVSVFPCRAIVNFLQSKMWCWSWSIIITECACEIITSWWVTVIITWSYPRSNDLVEVSLVYVAHSLAYGQFDARPLINLIRGVSQVGCWNFEVVHDSKVVHIMSTYFFLLGIRNQAIP